MDFCFEVDCSSYEKWLLSTGTQASFVSQLAYKMVLDQIRGAGQRDDISFHLEIFTRSQSRRDSLLSWRFKPLNLDFLQMAVVCRAKFVVEYLAKKSLSSPGHYRGDGVIVPREMVHNHPAHLAKLLGLTDILATLVDVMPWRDGCVHLPKVYVTPHNTIVYFNRKKVMVPSSSVAAAFPNPEGLLFSAAQQVDQHPENATSSIIEGIWDIVCTKPESSTKKPKGRFLNLPASEDIFNLYCHIHIAKNWTLLERVIRHLPFSSSPLEHVSRMAGLLWHDDLLEDEVRYLSRTFLANLCFSFTPSLAEIKKSTKAIEMVWEKPRHQSLQQMCVVTVLHHAQGNLRGLVEMGLPPGLLRQFHIPFLDLYQKLKAESG